MMKMIALFFLIFISLFPIKVWAEQIEIISFELPSLQNKERTGTYDKVINHYQEINHSFLPTKRAVVTFLDNNCKNCCISVWSIEGIEKEYPDYNSKKLIQSAPLGHAELYIFSKEIRYDSVTELRGKHIALKRGMPYNQNLDGINLNYTHSIESNIQMLNKGRVDAFLAYSPDVFSVYNKLKIQPDLTGKVINKLPDNVVCKSSKESLLFLEKLNLHLYKRTIALKN